MLTNVEVAMDEDTRKKHYEQLVTEVRKMCPRMRVARLCPATAHLSDRGRMACFVCNNRGCQRFNDLGLNDKGKALPEDQRPECGAKTKTGEPCLEPVVPGTRRCRLHGGLSTGPKTTAGRERVRQAQLKRWAKSEIYNS